MMKPNKEYCEHPEIKHKEISLRKGKYQHSFRFWRITRRNLNMNRPAMKRLIEDMKHNLFDSVLVWKLSRISRSVIDLLTLLKDFEKYNVQFVSYSEQFDLNAAIGKLSSLLIKSR